MLPRAQHNNTCRRCRSGLWLVACEDSCVIMSFCSWNSEKYRDHFEAGIYVCPKCGHELFSAKAKYKHNTPWPAFTETIQNDSVSKQDETEAQQSSKAKALKVRCGKCGNGLGHEFLKDGPDGVSSRF